VTGPVSPKLWTRDDFDTARLLAIGDFITGRTGEGGASYAAFLVEALAGAESLLSATADLSKLETGAALAAEPKLVAPLRFTAGPPFSEDDLATMAEVPKKPTKLTPAQAERIALILTAARDTARFPWLAAAVREAQESERKAAVLTTATLWAAQRMATLRRTESSKRQEEAVIAYIASKGFSQVATRVINIPDDIARGQVCAESVVAGTKADITVRLLNGRLLLIECKVSGSGINSVKRLNHEVGDKAATWKTAFGTQAYPMAVLAGVFKRKNLMDAQDKGIFIVWERDLASLGEFLAAAI
jgi:XamI restriction endonuclease